MCTDKQSSLECEAKKNGLVCKDMQSGIVCKDKQSGIVCKDKQSGIVCKDKQSGLHAVFSQDPSLIFSLTFKLESCKNQSIPIFSTLDVHGELLQTCVP